MITTRETDAIIGEIDNIPPAISDHHPLPFGLHISKPPSLKKAVAFRKVNAIATIKFQEDLENTPLVKSLANTLDALLHNMLSP